MVLEDLLSHLVPYSLKTLCDPSGVDPVNRLLSYPVHDLLSVLRRSIKDEDKNGTGWRSRVLVQARLVGIPPLLTGVDWVLPLL